MKKFVKTRENVFELRDPRLGKWDYNKEKSNGKVGYDANHGGRRFNNMLKDVRVLIKSRDPTDPIFMETLKRVGESATFLHKYWTEYLENEKTNPNFYGPPD